MRCAAFQFLATECRSIDRQLCLVIRWLSLLLEWVPTSGERLDCGQMGGQEEAAIEVQW